MPSRWARPWRNLSKEFATLIALGATASYFIVAFNDYRASRERVSYAQLESLRTTESFNDLRAQIDERNARTAQLVSELSELAQSPSSSSPLVAQQLAVVRHDINLQKDELKDLRTSVDSLRKAIESSPEKAITIPLLTKDLDDYKTSSERDIESLRAEMLRGYELNKWLIGLMLAAVFGMVFKGVLESRGSHYRRPNFE
jgi:hypothetical protein